MYSIAIGCTRARRLDLHHNRITLIVIEFLRSLLLCSVQRYPDGTVLIMKGDNSISLAVGSDKATVNKKTEVELGDPNLDGLIGERLHQQLTDEIELLDGAAAAFDLDRVRHGKLSPVFFGSALTNFGVETFCSTSLT